MSIKDKMESAKKLDLVGWNEGYSNGFIDGYAACLKDDEEYYKWHPINGQNDLPKESDQWVEDYYEVEVEIVNGRHKIAIFANNKWYVLNQANCPKLLRGKVVAWREIKAYEG